MFSSSLKVSFHLIPILALMGLAFGIQHQGLALPFSGKKKKNPPANAGDVDLIPGLGRLHGVGNGNPFQYSCLENSINMGTWWAAVPMCVLSHFSYV